MLARASGSEPEAPPGGGEAVRCGKFVLGRPIGEGGISTVFLGERVGGKPSQTVAIKVMKKARDTSSTAVALGQTDLPVC